MIVVRVVLAEGEKYQTLFKKCLYELYILQYDRIKRSKGIDVNKLDGSCLCLFFNILGKKSPTTLTYQFFPSTSTNVRFSPQNLLPFSFNFFPVLVKNSKFVPSASPKLLSLNEDHPSEKLFFRSGPY